MKQADNPPAEWKLLMSSGGQAGQLTFGLAMHGPFNPRCPMNWIGWVVRPFRSAYSTPHHAQHHPAGHVPRPDLALGSSDLPAGDPRRLRKGRKAVTLFWLGIVFLFLVPGLLLLWLAARSFGLVGGW